MNDTVLRYNIPMIVPLLCFL